MLCTLFPDMEGNVLPVAAESGDITESPREVFFLPLNERHDGVIEPRLKK